MKEKSQYMVSAWLLFEKNYNNPYGNLLYSAIQKKGLFTIKEFSLKEILFSRYDIIHIHWPEKHLSKKNYVESLTKTFRILFLLYLLKIKGSKIVWTIHNLVPHTSYHPKLDSWFYSIIIKIIDGFICLSPASYKQAVQKYPALKHIKHFTHNFGHGHYQEIYPNFIQQSQAKKRLRIDENSFSILFFGSITPYKNVPHLAELFQNLDRRDLTLIIAGKPNSTHLTSILENIAEKDIRIRLSLEYIPTEEVQYFLNASDLVVLPYDNLTNSGTALLSLTFKVPILVPEEGSMLDLQNLFGDKWIFTYKNILTVDKLLNVVEQIESEYNLKKEINLDLLNWDTIANETEGFYKNLLGFSNL